MANIKTVPSLPAAKAAKAAWDAIRKTNASTADKRKAKEAYARSAMSAAEEMLGEKLLSAGRRLVIK
jgi:hypothetical protein